MVVNVVECLFGAPRAQGIAVMVDVFQAYTVACYALENGASAVLAADSLERARELCHGDDTVFIGEENGRIVRDADCANYPSAVEAADISGKTVVMATDAGTKALFVSPNADEILLCGFVNAQATVDYIQNKEPEMVTMVAVGTDGDIRAQEDMMCAMFVKNELEEYPNSHETLLTFLAGVDSSEKFFDESRTDAPQEDYDLCMELDRFDFAVRGVKQEEGVMRLEKTPVA